MLILVSKEDIALQFPDWTAEQVDRFYKETFQFLHNRISTEAVDWVQFIGTQWLANSNVNKEVI